MVLSVAEQSRETQHVGGLDGTAPGLGFVHLHLHTEYSLLDGGIKIDRLVERVRELGMSAVAVTDHGNLHGAIEFYTKAKAAGIKPILGIEAYVATGDRLERASTGLADGGFHLVLLAEDDAGWRNLLKLSSDAFQNGFYYRPRMDRSTLARWSEGLIAINGHLGSSLAHHLTQYVQTKNDAHYQAALDEARWHAGNFSPNGCGEPRFYVELQRTGVPEQERINPQLVRLAEELGLPLVADNDAHFLRAEDYDAHDSLCCISMGRTKDDPSRLQYSRELYVKTPRQMAELFEDLPQAIENTGRIADRCNLELSFSASHAPMVRVVELEPLPEYDARDPSAWFQSFCSQFELLPYDAERDRQLTPPQLKDACDRAMRHLCEAGLRWRYGPNGLTPEIRARLEWELKVLADKLISAYFLIVWDVVNWAKQRGIPASARGSGVGTMVGYVLGLSNACPQRYGLLFERFTDPDRAENPDIDIDICQDGRGEVIDYVRRKYGHVAQIITFGRLKAKAAMKDVARVMGMSPGEGQRLANLVPSELHITLDAALEKEPDFKHAYASDDRVRKVVDTARALEDHARHAGVHAAGVVIATEPLDNIVPLCRTSGSDDVVTQWDGPTCERVGLLKMDFLGLRTLSIIERTRKLIEEGLPEEAIRRAVGQEPLPPSGEGGEPSTGPEPFPPGRTAHPHPSPLPQGKGSEFPPLSGSPSQPRPHPLDLDRLAYDDQKVLELFRRGDTAGIFQFESGGMRKLLLEMKPDRIEDLIAANALFRPGPMDLIPEYCLRKHGRQPVPQVHPIVDDFTAETYGIMVYQEQVMQIVHGLGDIPLREAYRLIKAISKKNRTIIDAERCKFIESAQRKGLSRGQAEGLFDLILKFAGYGFNKSHATGYAIVAYQTAYLKTYFPNQYMAALLTYESQARKLDDWTPYLEDCKHTIFPDHTPQRPHVGVEVRPPDINLSQADFSVVFRADEPPEAGRGHVRFGLGAIKGVGQSAIREIIAERSRNGPFPSIYDFSERLGLRSVNKATIEALVNCGAFDSVHGAKLRSAVFSAINEAIASGQSVEADRRSGQMSFFGAPDDGADARERSLPKVEPWDEMTRLRREKESLGIHVSGHPLDRYGSVLREICTTDARTAATLPHDAPVVLGGLLTRVRTTIVRHGQSAGQKMAMITLQDKVASVEGVVFAGVFARYAARLVPEAVVLLVGRMDRKRGEPQVIVDSVLDIEDAAKRFGRRLELDLVDDPDSGPVTSRLRTLSDALREHESAESAEGAGVPVLLHVYTDGKRITLRPGGLRVVPEAGRLRRIEAMLGASRVRLITATVPNPGRPKGLRRRPPPPVPV